VMFDGIHVGTFPSQRSTFIVLLGVGAPRQATGARMGASVALSRSVGLLRLVLRIGGLCRRVTYA
jgi:hypothetical protein